MPSAILQQWYDEIRRHVHPGALRVVVYGGQTQPGVNASSAASYTAGLAFGAVRAGGGGGPAAGKAGAGRKGSRAPKTRRGAQRGRGKAKRPRRRRRGGSSEESSEGDGGDGEEEQEDDGDEGWEGEDGEEERASSSLVSRVRHAQISHAVTVLIRQEPVPCVGVSPMPSPAYDCCHMPLVQNSRVFPFAPLTTLGGVCPRAGCC